MQFDYGHMEEGQLSRPYNMRLLKRLIPYSRPYRKPIVLAMVLTISITLLELALPYLPKVAIDRYILSRWYPVERHAAERDLQNDFNRKYGHLVVETEKPGLGFISGEKLKQIDPADLRRYHQGGLVSKESFYRVSLEAARKYGLSGPEELAKAPDS